MVNNFLFFIKVRRFFGPAPREPFGKGAFSPPSALRIPQQHAEGRLPAAFAGQEDFAAVAVPAQRRGLAEADLIDVLGAHFLQRQAARGRTDAVLGQVKVAEGTVNSRSRSQSSFRMVDGRAISSPVVTPSISTP